MANRKYVSCFSVETVPQPKGLAGADSEDHLAIAIPYLLRTPQSYSVHDMLNFGLVRSLVRGKLGTRLANAAVDNASFVVALHPNQ